MKCLLTIAFVFFTTFALCQETEVQQIRYLLADMSNELQNHKGDSTIDGSNYYYKSKIVLRGTQNNTIVSVYWGAQPVYNATIINSATLTECKKLAEHWRGIIKIAAPDFKEEIEYYGNPCCSYYFQGYRFTKHDEKDEVQIRLFLFKTERDGNYVQLEILKYPYRPFKDDLEIDATNKYPSIRMYSRLTGKPLNYGTVIVNDKNHYPDTTGTVMLRNLKTNKIHLQLIGTRVGFADTTFELISHSQSIYFKPNCETDFAIEAEKDIRNGKIQLIVDGGLRLQIPCTPIIDPDTLEKLGLKLIDYGCSPPAEDCVILYNKVVIDYLDNKYTKDWRKKVNGKLYGL